MDRRDFLRVTGATAIGSAWSAGSAAAQGPAAATVLFDDRAVALTTTAPDPGKVADALWVQKTDLPRINGFELKPQGMCRADICIPVPQSMTRGQYFNLTAFGKRAGQAVVADPGARAWSFSEMPVLRGEYLSSRMAPDFAVPDRKGRLVRLSSFRGKKVLVVTWASW